MSGGSLWYGNAPERNGGRHSSLIEPLERRVLLSSSPAIELFSISPALFIENQGQWDQSIHFLHQGRAANVAMTRTGPVIDLFRQEAGEADPPPGQPPSLLSKRIASGFVGAAAVTPVGQQPSDGRFNFFIGEQANWRSEVPAYERVVYAGLYEGIDLHTWGLRSSLKYEFHVAPGVDYRQIQVQGNRICPHV